MSKALRHLLHRELSRGWVGWHAQWQEVVRKRESARLTKQLLKGGLTRMCNRKLSAGWNSWAEMMAERRRAMDLMRRGASFMKHRKLAPAFQSWLGAFGPRAEKAKQKRASMVKSLRHLLYRELSRGWVGWHAQWLEATRKRDSMSKSLLHLMNRKLSAGWLSWAAMAADRRDAIDRQAGTRSVLLHLANRKLSFGWNSWVAMAAARRRPLELVRRGLGFLVNRKLGLAFMSWLGAVEEEERNLPNPYPNPHSMLVALTSTLTITAFRRVSSESGKAYRDRCSTC